MKSTAQSARQSAGASLVATHALPSYGGDLKQPKAKTRMWSSLAKSLARPTRWSSLSVASFMLGQLGILKLTGKWPTRPPTAHTMRGVDFYPWKDLVHAVIRGAHMFKAENGFLPNLVSPSSFNEYIFAREFFTPLPMPTLANKLEAKKHVKALLGDGFSASPVWSGDNIGGLFAAEIPAGRHVLKINNGWNSNLFLSLPNDLANRRDEVEQWAKKGLCSRFGYDWGEWHYCTIEPKLFLEEFIDFNGDQTPDDYKILCFHGKASLIEVDVDRLTDLRSAFYTPDWKLLPVTYGERPVERPRPRNLEDMIRVAEAVAGAMDFVRIDLYSDGNSKIFVGEITFFPGNAGLHFSDFKLDLWLGSHFGQGPPPELPWKL